MRSPIPSQGSTVWIRQRPWQVERVTVCRHVLRLDVRDRYGPLSFLAPFDRILSGGEMRRPKQVSVASAVARLAGIAGSSARWTLANAAVDARVDLHPHQFEPLLALLRGARRVLIADEAGLGKTIQAGLVLAELQRRHSVVRALVTCPVSLRNQWAEELEHRFSLKCRIADRETLVASRHFSPAAESPWNQSGIWIASIDFLKQPHVLEGIPFFPWDVLVIDEAHEAGGATDRHEACHELACRARRVLLLTATPHSGNQSCFERLTAIGKLENDDDLVVFRRTRQEVAFVTARRVRWHMVRPSAEEVTLLGALERYEQAVLRAAGHTRTPAALLLLSVFRKRALSTTHALARSIARRLEWLASPDLGYALDWMQPSLAFELPPLDDMGEEEREGLTIETGLRPADERVWLKRLLALATIPPMAETKLQRVTHLLRRAREPVVVFTEFRDSLAALQARLDRTRPMSVLHGGLSLQSRREALRKFEEGDTSVLFTTDVAGQGLNLQAASRWVIGLELPWNPARLEQRVGRVDRIGQSRPVHATLIVSKHDTESALLARLSRRVLTAQRALGEAALSFVAPPAEAALALRLFRCTTEDPEEPTIQVHPCTTLRRTARATASVIAKRRQLMERWRGAAPLGRPFRCRPRAAGMVMWDRLIHATPTQAIAVFSIPILDALHHVLERHLIVIAGPGVTTRVEAAAREAIERVTRERLEARRKRLEAMASTLAASREHREAAILRRLEAMSRPEQAQSHLFSRAPIDALETGHRTADRLEQLSRTEASHARASSQIVVGSPRLELLVQMP